MSLLRSLRRCLSALALVVWGVGAVLPSLADGALERAAKGSVSHVEAPGGAPAHVGHDHAACQLCQTLHWATTATAAATLPQPARRLSAPASRWAAAFHEGQRRSDSARAPPIA